MPIITTSNDLPPAPTSRVVTWRSLPSSRIVYLTLIPVFAVKSDGVNDAMSCICGLATIAMLIVLAVGRPIAVAASDATATIATTSTPTKTFAGGRLLTFRGSCMVTASSRADPMPEKITLSGRYCQEARLSGRISAAFSDHDKGIVVKTTFHDRSASDDDRRSRSGRCRLEDGFARRQRRAGRQPGARGEGQARDRA